MRTIFHCRHFTQAQGCLCGSGSSDPGSWNREVSKWNGFEEGRLSGRRTKGSGNFVADGFRARKPCGGTARRENGLRVVRSSGREAAGRKSPGPGKQRCGTVRRGGGFRAAEPKGREAPRWKGPGPGSSDTERFDGKAAFGALDRRIGKDRNGKVRNPDGVAPTGRWEEGLRVVGPSNGERER